MTTRRAANLAITALGIALTACGSPTSPGVQPQIRSLTDSFEFQVSSVADYSGTLTYTFANTGAQATVNQASSVTGGSATIVVLDAGGKQVYTRPMADNGTFLTDTGSPGTWTVRVQMNAASGTFNFRVQKKT